MDELMKLSALKRMNKMKLSEAQKDEKKQNFKSLDGFKLDQINQRGQSTATVINHLYPALSQFPDTNVFPS